MTGITLKALNDAGHEAKGLILGGDIKQSHRDLKVFPYKKGITSSIHFIKWYLYFLYYVYWADVIHWNGSFSFFLLKFTLPVIKFSGKLSVVEFVGSDIRVPEIEFADNPFYKEAFSRGYEYPYESKLISDRNIKLFDKAGFAAVILPGMEQYFPENYFNHRVKLLQRIFTDEFLPSYPDPLNTKPVIVHILYQLKFKIIFQFKQFNSCNN